MRDKGCSKVQRKSHVFWEQLFYQNCHLCLLWSSQPGLWISPATSLPYFLCNAKWSQVDCKAWHLRSPDCILDIQSFMVYKHPISFAFPLFIPLIRCHQQLQCWSKKNPWGKYIPYVLIPISFGKRCVLPWPPCITLPLGGVALQRSRLGASYMHCLRSPTKHL